MVQLKFTFKYKVGLLLSTPFFWIAASLLFFLLTQTWLPFEEGIHHVFANDSYSYLAIARAAPYFPSHLIPSYHAQRFVLHYVIGLISYLSHVPVEWVYRGAVVALTYAILDMIFRVLTRLDINFNLKAWLLGAFILNPYTFRYYWIVPALLGDLVFVYSLGILIIGLMDFKQKWIYAGVLLGALARQNEILILPGLWFGIYFLPNWSSKSLIQKFSLCGVTGLLTVGVFKGSLWLSHSFSSLDAFPISIMYSIFPWILSSDFQWSAFIIHTLKSIIPYFTFLALLYGVVLKSAKQNWLRPELLCPLLMIAGLVAGAFLPSPHYQQKSESRYASLGIFLAVLFIGYAWHYAKNIKFKKFTESKAAYVLAILALGISTFHHLYTSIGPKSVEHYIVLQVAACFVLALSFNQCLDSPNE